MRVAEFARPGEHLVRNRGRRERERKLTGGLAGEANVLFHQRDVEPCLLGEIEQSGTRALSIGEAIELVLIASAATGGSIPPRSASSSPSLKARV